MMYGGLISTKGDNTGKKRTPKNNNCMKMDFRIKF